MEKISPAITIRNLIESESDKRETSSDDPSSSSPEALALLQALLAAPAGAMVAPPANPAPVNVASPAPATPSAPREQSAPAAFSFAPIAAELENSPEQVHVLPMDLARPLQSEQIRAEAVKRLKAMVGDTETPDPTKPAAPVNIPLPAPTELPEAPAPSVPPAPQEPNKPVVHSVAPELEKLPGQVHALPTNPVRLLQPEDLRAEASQRLQAMLREPAAPAAPEQTETDAPKSEDSVPPVPQNLGASILESFTAAAKPLTPIVSQAPQVAASEVPRNVEMDDLLNTVAQEVLVTDPLHSSRSEVRIRLADNVLPQTELRISHSEGRLRVDFVTASAESARQLSDFAGVLSSRLTERLNLSDPALVSVQTSGDAPGDGRSRQRFGAWTGQNEEEERKS